MMTRFIPRIAVLGALQGELASVWSTWRDPRTPWPAKAVLVVAAAYVLLPFDLIWDFAPVIGWLDDLAIVPLALSLFQSLAAGRRAVPVTAGVVAR